MRRPTRAVARARAEIERRADARRTRARRRRRRRRRRAVDLGTNEATTGEGRSRLAPCTPTSRCSGTCSSIYPARGEARAGQRARSRRPRRRRRDERAATRGGDGASPRRSIVTHLQVDVGAQIERLAEDVVLLDEPPLPRPVLLHASLQRVLLLDGPFRLRRAHASGRARARVCVVRVVVVVVGRREFPSSRRRRVR